MKLFISWSGSESHKVAKILRDWLQQVMQYVEPFMSSDMTKGATWFSSVQSNLDKCDIGIICVTKENMNNPWLLFESGALSKHVGIASVCPLLIGLDPADLAGPLSQFQATKVARDDILGLVQTINEKLPAEKRRPVEQLLQNFDIFWANLKDELDDVIGGDFSKKVVKEHRPTDDKVNEVLSIVRGLYRSFHGESSILHDLHDVALEYKNSAHNVFPDQRHANRYLIELIESESRESTIKKANIVQYSSDQVKEVIYTLIEANVEVDLYLQHPSRAISQLQKTKIETQLQTYSSIYSERPEKADLLKIFLYYDTAVMRVVKIDNAIALGFYSYQNPADKTKWCIHGHDNPVFYYPPTNQLANRVLVAVDESINRLRKNSEFFPLFETVSATGVLEEV